MAPPPPRFFAARVWGGASQAQRVGHFASLAVVSEWGIPV